MGVMVGEKPLGGKISWLFVSHGGILRSKDIGDEKNEQGAAQNVQPLELTGGADGTRTHALRRDRPAL